MTACRIGTPAAIVPLKIRDQRAIATFCTTSPIFIGILSFIESHWKRPCSVFFHWAKATPSPMITGMMMNQAPVIASEALTVIWVGSGSAELSPGVSSAISMKIPAKIGTMKATTTIITTSAKPKTSAGYIIAERIWRFRASSFSSWKATISSACSSWPEPSPARTIER